MGENGAIGFRAVSGFAEVGSFDELIAAAKSGKDWAWADLYRFVAGPVTGFLRARGAQDPTDLTGDVFFELARSISRFNGDESAFRTFVFAIAYGKLSEAREHAPSRRTALADDVLDILREAGHLEVDDSLDEIADRVRTAFDVLSSEQCDVLSLRIIAGLSLQETATVVELGVGRVKSIQRRAMSKVRGEQQLVGVVS